MDVKKTHLYMMKGLISTVNEIWEEIKGYGGSYLISNLGNIKSIHKNWSILNKKVDRYGYYCATLSLNGKHKTFTIHRLVAQAFIPNPENKPQVNHKDGNKLNNCVENLEWCTNKENHIHAWKIGLQKKRFGKYNDKSKRVYQYDKQMNFICEYESTRDVERKTGFDHSHISDCCIGKTKQAYGYIWKYNKKEGN